MAALGVPALLMKPEKIIQFTRILLANVRVVSLNITYLTKSFYELNDSITVKPRRASENSIDCYHYALRTRFTNRLFHAR